MSCRGSVLLVLFGLFQAAFPYEQELRFVEGLTQEGFPGLAQTVLNRTLREFPEAKPLSEPLRIRLLIAQKEFKQASSQIQEGENTESLWLFLAETAYAAQKLSVAEAAYKTYFQIVAEPDEQAAFHYGELLERSGENKKAIRLYERVSSRPVKAQLARLLAASDPDRSVQLCEEIQLGGPDLWFGQAVVSWAQIKLQAGEREEVQSVLETQLEILKGISDPLDASIAPLAGARYFLGLCYEQVGKNAEALHQLYNVYAQYGDSPWGPRAQEKAQALIDRFEAQGKTVRIDLGANHERMEAGRFRIARRLFFEKQFAEAVPAYLSALTEAPESDGAIAALRELMRCFIQLEDPLTVNVIGLYLGERFSGTPAAGDALLAAGKAALDQKQESLAWKLYDSYLKAFPEHPRAPSVIYSLAGLKSPEEQKRFWLRVVEEYPDSPYAVRALGRLAWGAFEAEEYEAAASRFEQYVSAEIDAEKLTRARFALANSHRLSSHWKAALETFQALENILAETMERFGISDEARGFSRPFLEKSIFYQAVCSAKLDDVDAAVKTCDRFIKTFPESDLIARARFVQGEVLFEHARFDEALAALAEFEVSAERKFLEPVLYYRGQALFETGRYEESVQSLEALLTRWPGSAFFFEAKLVQGRALAAAGQGDEAVRVLSDVLNYTTDDLLIHCAGIALGRAQTDPTEKLASFQRVALLADPSDEAQAALIAEALYESLPLYLELNRYNDLLADANRLDSDFPAFGKADEITTMRRQAQKRKEELTADHADVNG